MTKMGPIHLVERAAARLREQASLAALGGQSLDGQSLDEQTLDGQALDRQPFDGQPLDGQSLESRSLESRRLDGRSLEGQPLGGDAQTPSAKAAPRADGSAPPLVLDRAALERAGLLPVMQRRNRIGEEMRIAAGNVLRAARAAAAGAPGAGTIGSRAPEQAAPLVMVTSCRAGEGKSFASLNLAATLAEQGVARVLLVDIDPKPDALSGLLGVQGRPGLCELAGDAGRRSEQLIVRTAIRDLSVLPLGRQDGSRQGVTRGIATALERLARRHAGHLILLDAPPCLATSEASSLAPLVSLTVLLVEAERTQRAALERAVDLLKACPNIMLLLNKLHSTRSDDFGGYDYYGV